jgi:hypothetical protein
VLVAGLGLAVQRAQRDGEPGMQGVLRDRQLAHCSGDCPGSLETPRQVLGGDLRQRDTGVP